MRSIGIRYFDCLHSQLITQKTDDHLSYMLESPLGRLSLLDLLGKAFQKRRVSSPAPVTIVSPLGLIARKRTLLEWPVSVAVFCSEGYFQIVISLLEQPCVLTISLVFLENMRLQTCEPVSMLSSSEPSSVFQNLMVLSADPPPEASTPWLCGLQASAFTAAQCKLNLLMGAALLALQRNSLLSLPPEASRLLSNDHFSPHTSCVCPSFREIRHYDRSRMSRITTVRSREPLARIPSPQATELTLAV